MMDSFYSDEELRALGFQSLGQNVRISRKASFYGASFISMGNQVRIDDFAVLSAGERGIRLGSYVHIACFCALYGQSGIVMEDFTGLSSRSAIYSETDDFSGRSLMMPMIPREFKPGYRSGEVILQRHAMVATHATVLPGVLMGEGSVLGAHSLANAPCKAWTIYGGVPAKELKARAKDVLVLEKAFLGRQDD